MPTWNPRICVFQQTDIMLAPPTSIQIHNRPFNISLTACKLNWNKPLPFCFAKLCKHATHAHLVIVVTNLPGHSTPPIGRWYVLRKLECIICRFVLLAKSSPCQPLLYRISPNISLFYKEGMKSLSKMIDSPAASAKHEARGKRCEQVALKTLFSLLLLRPFSWLPFNMLKWHYMKNLWPSNSIVVQCE